MSQAKRARLGSHGTSVRLLRSGIAAMSGSLGSWPISPAANPAKPAPSATRPSRLAAGTSFALGRPYRSTNCAKKNSTPRSAAACRTSSSLGSPTTTITAPILRERRETLGPPGQPPRDEADEEEPELRILVVELEHLVLLDRSEAALALADGRQRAGAARREQPDLAEDVAGRGGLVGLGEANGPGLDDVQPVCRVAPFEEDGAAGVDLRLHVGKERPDDLLIACVVDDRHQPPELRHAHHVQRQQARMEHEDRVDAPEHTVVETEEPVGDERDVAGER